MWMGGRWKSSDIDETSLSVVVVVVASLLKVLSSLLSRSHMASRRFGLISSLSSSSTLSSHSHAYHHPHPSPSPLLSPTSLEFLPSSSSSVPSNNKGQRRRSRKQSRKLLAEKQELERIMDPTYLGSSSSSFWNSNSKGNYCHAELEGYWHDIDYRPFPRIKPENELVQRSFDTSLRSPSPSSSSSSSSFSSYQDPLQPHRNTNSKSRTTPVPLAYWETFIIPSPTTSLISHDTDENEKDKPEKIKSEDEFYSTLLKNQPFPRSPSPSSFELSDHSYNYDFIVQDPIEPAYGKRQVLKKKKKKNLTNMKRCTGEKDDAMDNSSSYESSELKNDNADVPQREGRTKFESPSRSSQCNGTSKTERLHEAWVTMSFIARLKVIRTQRWLRDHVIH